MARQKKRAEDAEDAFPDTTPVTPSANPLTYNFRYVVSLAKPNEPNCFKDFFETDTLSKAKEKCIDKACDEGRECVVFDREEWGDPFVFRYKPEAEEVTDDRAATAPAEGKPKPKHKRSRR